MRPHADNPHVKALTRGQKSALAAMLAGQSCFNTGAAGTGKSYLVDVFSEIARKQIVKCAPTGVAAINVGAQTIHGLLVGECSDMCIRPFRATGIVNFDNDIVTLNGSWLFEARLEELGDRFTLDGTGNIKEYENDLSSVWFRDVTTT